MVDDVLYERIHARTIPVSTGCWEWQGARTKHYGFMEYHGKQNGAHRFMWQAVHGIIPDEMFVLHKCDNGFCVNPDHLFLGSQADNVHDCMKKGRFPEGERQGGSILTIEAVQDILSNKHLPSSFFAKKYGVNGRTVRQARLRRSWKHVREIPAKEWR